MWSARTVYQRYGIYSKRYEKIRSLLKLGIADPVWQAYISKSKLVRGWRRSRLFELIDGPGQEPGFSSFIVIDEFDRSTALDDSEMRLLQSTGLTLNDETNAEERIQRQFEFYHEFQARDYRRPPEPSITTHNADVLRERVAVPSRLPVKAM